jgi:type I site-specific restriction-modification system R (restriction) subunit
VNKINESAIKLLKKQGYQYIYGPDIVLGTREYAIEQIQRINSYDLVAYNEAYHRYLNDGRFMTWKASYRKVEASSLIGQLKTIIRGMLYKKTLLDLICHFILD